MDKCINVKALKGKLLLKAEMKGEFNLFNFIFNLENPEGVTLPWILKFYLAHDGWREALSCKDKESYRIKKRYEKRLRSVLETLKQDGIITLTRGPDSLIWIRPTPLALNLIVRTTEICPDLEKTGNRSTPLQNFAAGYCLGTKISPEQYRAIYKVFGKYQDSVSSSQIIVRSKETTNIAGEVRSIPCALGNRYVDGKVQDKILQKFHGSWDLASSRHDKAVFLTVTLDRLDYRSVLDANRKFPTSLHIFNKKIFRIINKEKSNPEPDRITVHEFQKDGYLHAHILYFGINYLMHYRALSGLCHSCGLGPVVYIYSLRRDVSSGELTWSKERPNDVSPRETAQQYLEGYLQKNIKNPQQLALYWVFRQRFFTTSRFLTIKERKKARTSHTVLRCCKSIHADEMVKMYEQRIADNLEYLKGPAVV
jgi:hypothetical protein